MAITSWPGITILGLGKLTLLRNKGRILAFVEVKAREENSLVSPFESINRQKQRKILATAKAYLQRHPCDLQPRFDAAAVYLKNGKIVGEVNLENAFWG